MDTTAPCILRCNERLDEIELDDTFSAMLLLYHQSPFATCLLSSTSTSFPLLGHQWDDADPEESITEVERDSHRGIATCPLVPPYPGGDDTAPGICVKESLFDGEGNEVRAVFCGANVCAPPPSLSHTCSLFPS